MKSKDIHLILDKEDRLRRHLTALSARSELAHSLRSQVSQRGLPVPAEAPEVQTDKDIPETKKLIQAEMARLIEEDNQKRDGKKADESETITARRLQQARKLIEEELERP